VRWLTTGGSLGCLPGVPGTADPIVGWDDLVPGEMVIASPGGRRSNALLVGCREWVVWRSKKRLADYLSDEAGI
jgi:hypothetical protein